MSTLLASALLLLAAAAIVWLIGHFVSQDRYSKMTEEEFEAEAQRASLLGAGVVELQKHLDPLHKVEYLQQRDKHVEAEREDSGDRPPEGRTPTKEAGR